MSCGKNKQTRKNTILSNYSTKTKQTSIFFLYCNWIIMDALRLLQVTSWINSSRAGKNIHCASYMIFAFTCINPNVTMQTWNKATCCFRTRAPQKKRWKPENHQPQRIAVFWYISDLFNEETRCGDVNKLSSDIYLNLLLQSFVL